MNLFYYCFNMSLSPFLVYLQIRMRCELCNLSLLKSMDLYLMINIFFIWKSWKWPISVHWITCIHHESTIISYTVQNHVNMFIIRIKKFYLNHCIMFSLGSDSNLSIRLMKSQSIVTVLCCAIGTPRMLCTTITSKAIHVERVERRNAIGTPRV